MLSLDDELKPATVTALCRAQAKPRNGVGTRVARQEKLEAWRRSIRQKQHSPDSLAR